MSDQTMSSAPENDPWDKYRALLDEYLEAYTHAPFQEVRDVDLFGPIMQQTPEDIASVLLVAINRLSATIIETQEQLDSLPFLAIIREVFKPSPGRGVDYGGVYERRTSGWHPISGTYRDPADNGAPKLPCRVLYNPDLTQ